MKKLYTLVGAALFSSALFAQASFSDDFESYTVGAYLGPQPQWTTWSGASSTTEDTQVNNTMNNTPSGSKSAYYSSALPAGGPQDCVLPFGGQYNTGTFTYQMDMFVEANKGAYFNFQGNTTLGQSFAMECYMPQTGAFTMQNQQGLLLTGNYPSNQWFTFRFDVNLNANVWSVYINNVLQGSFSNTVNQIAAIDIFAYNGAAPGNNNAGFYIDDVSYLHTPYTLPGLNAAVTQIAGVTSGLATMSKYPTVTVRNLGTTTINSFDLSVTYNSQTINQSFSSLTLASLASATYTLTTPITLAAGNLPIMATVSNVNGMGADGDPSDDSKTMNLNPVVPAPGKVVVGEEATGTWCPWCVRGTVNMDLMANTYGGFWAGIAVHNADPMTVTAYDASMGSHVSGYPSVLVDRQAAIDPSAVEAPFLTRVQVAPVATITDAATLVGNQLTVTLTYTFPNAMSGTGYKYACVLTEDGVTGVGSTWSQNNAYAGGGNGVMGGYESLPNPVPYTQMHYDHVARAISPGWNGTAGFPASISAGQSIPFTFTFTVPANWNLSNMHIIGMLIDPSDLINNGSIGSVAADIGLSVAQADATNANINVYPNPTSGNSFANVELSSPANVTMKIMDITGAVVAERNYGELSGANMLPIETSTLAKGIYLVQIQTGSTVTTTKLIVQ
jgi:hypothetical protein